MSSSSSTPSSRESGSLTSQPAVWSVWARLPGGAVSAGGLQGNAAVTSGRRAAGVRGRVSASGPGWGPCVWAFVGVPVLGGGVSAHSTGAGTVRLEERRWAVSPEDSVTVQWPGYSLDCPRTMPRRPLMGFWTCPWTMTSVPAWSRGGIQAAKRQ